MKKEHTVVISKVPVEHPAAYIIKLVVSRSLSSTGYRCKCTDVVLLEADINRIWSNVPLTIRCALLEKLTGRTVTAWMIKGVNAVRAVYDLKGLATDPDKCFAGTWRHDLAGLLSVRRVQLQRVGNVRAVRTFDNFVHAPDEAGVRKDLKVLSRFFQ
jgi:hypothetical protein